MPTFTSSLMLLMIVGFCKQSEDTFLYQCFVFLFFGFFFFYLEEFGIWKSVSPTSTSLHYGSWKIRVLSFVACIYLKYGQFKFCLEVGFFPS